MLDIRFCKCGPPESDHSVLLGNFLFPREFACKCGCGKCDIDFELWFCCQLIRQRFNAPVTIRSGCRCEAHNQAIGGSEKSDHIYGWAADIVVAGEGPDEVARFAATLAEVKRIGVYEEGFVHVGVRDRGAGKWKRWRFDTQRNLIESA